MVPLACTCLSISLCFWYSSDVEISPGFSTLLSGYIITPNLATNISRLTIRAPGFGQTSKRLNWSDSDVTPMRRTLWLCPKCSELKPTRHENVVRHVNRKHASVGEPVSVTTGQTRNQMLALGLLSPIGKSFMRKSVSSQEFHDNPSAMLDYKIKNTDTPTESSNLTNEAIMLYLVSRAKETQQDMQKIINQNFTIIKILNDIAVYVSKPRQSSNNNTFGDFA